MNPDDPTAGTAGPGPENLADLRLTQTQKAILEALCRPQMEGNRWATPATNQEIASKVYLSVDAVKAHLRVLYRKFGVEPLPHNQKRARLVELVFEGNVLELPASEEPTSAETPLPDTPASPRPAPSTAGDDPARSEHGEPEPAPPLPDKPGRRSLLVAAGLAGIAAVVVLLLATGALGGDDADPATEPTPLPEYRSELNLFCGFAFPFDPPGVSLPVDRRANEFYEALAPVGNRISELPPPAGEQPGLSRFLAGLESATEINNEIALDPPRGRAAERDFADLTIASGQVQAGAIGFDLGPDCKAIAGLIVQSADSIARG